VSNYTNLADEPADHALGRSRGGWTTKIHALVDARCAPLVVTLTAGQAGDNPQLQPLLMRHTHNGARGFRLLADKAYSHDSTRAYLRRHRIAHTIPERCDQIMRRKAKGSNGGRPPGFDPTRYRHRNGIVKLVSCLVAARIGGRDRCVVVVQGTPVPAGDHRPLRVAVPPVPAELS
jgi:putative transposase